MAAASAAVVSSDAAVSSAIAVSSGSEVSSDAAVAYAGAPLLTKLRHYFDNPGFIAANVAALTAALADLSAATRLVFTAHSIPVSMNETSGPAGGLYLAQQHAIARLVAEQVRGVGASFDLVWQSRSGPPQVPWLEPDVNDHLRALAVSGVRDVVLAPTGFISDHMEVMWDLDLEAADTARSLGIRLIRAATAGTHPAFVAGIAALIAEQLGGAHVAGLSELGVCGWQCPAACCPAPVRRPRPGAAVG